MAENYTAESVRAGAPDAAPDDLVAWVAEVANIALPEKI